MVIYSNALNLFLKLVMTCIYYSQTFSSSTVHGSNYGKFELYSSFQLMPGFAIMYALVELGAIKVAPHCFFVIHRENYIEERETGK